MLSGEEWAQLLHRLNELTNRDKLDWKIAGDEVSTQVSGSVYSFTSADHDGVAPWVLHIFAPTPAGNVEEVARLHSADDTWQIPAAGQIDALRDKAMRAALGGPQLIRRLLSDLDGLDHS